MRLAAGLIAAALLLPAAAQADHPSPATPSTSAAPTRAEMVQARRHFFGAENVDAAGRVRSDKVILSWFSVASFAAAIRGHVVLLDTYIHKGEDRPAYVPTTTDELAALRPETIFIGHGHFDHANTAGRLAARTGALIVGTPEHCDQAREQANAYAGRTVTVRCMAAVSRGSEPGAELRQIRPLGEGVGVTALKHVHSATEPPDGGHHETSLILGALPDPSLVLLHPPGPSVIKGLNPAGAEGSSLLYRFRVGGFSLVWHDSSGPLRERARQIFRRLRALPATDVEIGSVLGFNDPTNGMRDPVDYVTSLRPRIFYPDHHDFIAEYGLSRSLLGTFRRELARRSPVPTDVRWLYDPTDYLRPQLMTFDVGDERFTTSCLARRAPVGRRGIGRVRLRFTRRQALRRVLPQPVGRRKRSYRWCVKRSKGRVTAVFSRRGRIALVATTARSHGNRGVRPGHSAARLSRYPQRVRIATGLFRAQPGSRRVIGVARGRVRFVAVAGASLVHRPRRLRRYLRYAGLP